MREERGFEEKGREGLKRVLLILRRKRKRECVFVEREKKRRRETDLALVKVNGASHARLSGVISGIILGS